jgi:ribosomal protein L16 Arg81 hydroxylase
VIRASGRELLELLAPHDVTSFLADYWGHKPMYVPGSPSRFDALRFDLSTFEASIRTPAPDDRMRVRFVGRDDKVHDAPIDLASFSVAESDLTVCADQVDDRFEALAVYCSSIKTALALAGPVFMTCYASPPGHGFGMHWDCQPSFILQLHGSKQWRFSARPAVAWPPVIVANAAILSKVTERYPWLDSRFPTRRDDATFVEQTLTAGDVLYLPAGTWHQAQAIDDISLALTMACTPLTAADLIVDVLRGHLSSSESWRASVPPSPVSASPADRLPPEVAVFLDDRLGELRELISVLTVEVLYETWLHHVASSNGRVGATNRPPARRIDPSDAMSPATKFPVRYVQHPNDRVVTVYYLDHRIDMDRDTLPLINAIVERRSFRAGTVTEWITTYDWSDIEPVLSTLLHAGILNVTATSDTR